MINEERLAAADLLRRFVAGNIGKHELDDFISCRSKDELIERVRKQVIAIPDKYPTDNPANYASNEGLSEIISLANELKSDG